MPTAGGKPKVGEYVVTRDGHRSDLAISLSRIRHMAELG